jgi:hypothetical protein
MAKSKTTTPEVVPSSTSRFQRAIYLLLAVGNLAVAAYLGILLADPDLGRWVLVGISTVTSVYFAYKTIE